MNIAMEATIEHFPNGEQGEQYGDAFIRGNNGKNDQQIYETNFQL